MTTLLETVELERTSCCVCGAVFAMPTTMLAQRRANGASFFCPNGHSLSFGDTTVKQLERQVQRERAWADQARADARNERYARQKTERRLASTRGVVTRTKNRIARGLCPCCHKKFEALATHMESAHPGYGKDDR
jgi:hypothetical protein